jgi:hypothetical protein
MRRPARPVEHERAVARRPLTDLLSIDRLMRGRISIAVVAFALIGIVTLQLGLLKLNGGIGRALEHEGLLQRENAALSIEISEMAAGDRVELQAARIGMELVPPGGLRFLAVRPRIDVTRGAAALSTRVSAASGGVATAPSASATGSTAAEGASGATVGGEASSASGEAATAGSTAAMGAGAASPGG